jgi:hypothetical protein
MILQLCLISNYYLITNFSFAIYGMEHPTIKFLNPYLLLDNKIDGIPTVIHEIANSWTGNTVTT